MLQVVAAHIIVSHDLLCAECSNHRFATEYACLVLHGDSHDLEASLQLATIKSRDEL